MKRVTTDDGLVNQNVASLLEDDDGSLWIGTRHGLSRYEPASGRFHNYGLGDGLPSNEFNPGAAWRGKDGLHFGTSRGLLVIRPGTPFVEPAVAPTQITDIRTLAGPLRLPATPWETEALEVPYGTPLLFAFSVLDFRSPAPVRVPAAREERRRGRSSARAARSRSPISPRGATR